MENTKYTIKKRNTPFNWVILITAFFVFIPSLLMDRLWIDLRSVNVLMPMQEDGEIYLEVDRSIFRDFTGGFLVSIHEVGKDTLAPVCSGTSYTPFPYKADNQLPEPLPLSWWVGSKEHLETCKNKGFVKGKQFIIKTCHTVYWTIWDIPIARRCVFSNPFTLR